MIDEDIRRARTLPADFYRDAATFQRVRERVLARHVRSATEMEAHNANYVGGDIATGANDPVQFVIRPRLALDPYATGVPGVFLCSAATPPGAAVHGMCGFNAAQSALRDLEYS